MRVVVGDVDDELEDSVLVDALSQEDHAVPHLEVIKRRHHVDTARHILRQLLELRAHTGTHRQRG